MAENVDVNLNFSSNHPEENNLLVKRWNQFIQRMDQVMFATFGQHTTVDACKSSQCSEKLLENEANYFCGLICTETDLQL